MLTLPKWQTVWLMCQYSSTSIPRKRMFSKSGSGILDNLISCCHSASKHVALEALNCWRIWIENQQVENWKLNEICYTAVQPLLTKKFHPLLKDDEVTEMKLSLFWMALQKTQSLMHLEGPQHILEVFVQSCLTWLCSSDDIHVNIRDLILRLLKFLFPSSVEVEQGNEKFPPLNNNIWKSNRLFCRVLTHWVELFRHWTKIEAKTDLLFMWNHVLVNCDQAFKLIPVPVWHQIFKLVENICLDSKELINHKFALLHQCATSLTSVLTNSKFIDCKKGLTMPAEVFLKIIIDLSINHKDENISFEIVHSCLETCQILSSCIIQSSDYESCFYKLSKIEEIETKPLLWAIWCGFANAFRNEVNDENWKVYSKMDLKLYRKLRSVAVNFDLDRTKLDKKSEYLIQNQLQFLRISIAFCKNCQPTDKKRTENEISVIIASDANSCTSSQNHVGKGKRHEFEVGVFGFSDKKTSNLKALNCYCPSRSTNSSLEIYLCRNNMFKKENQCSENTFCEGCQKERTKITLKYKCWWLRLNSGLENLEGGRVLQLFCPTIESERLITIRKESEGELLCSPSSIISVLEKLRKVACKSFETTTNEFVEKVTKLEHRVKQGSIFTPMKLFVSFKGTKGVEFYSNAFGYWNDLKQIFNDVDFVKNLNVLMAKNENSAVWLSMFLFLVNFTRNVYIEEKENSISVMRKFDPEEEMALTVALIGFMQKVSYYKRRLSNLVFLENMNKILPRKRSNPIVIWTNLVSSKNSKTNESAHERFSKQDCGSKTSSDNIMNIFIYFDELRNRISNDIDITMSELKKTRKRNIGGRNGLEKISSRLRAYNGATLVPEKEVTIMENENVTVVKASPDFFRTMNFSSDWRSASNIRSSEVIIRESGSGESISNTAFTVKKRKRTQRNTTRKKYSTPVTKTVPSSVIRAETIMNDHNYGAVQDENVNIAFRSKNCKQQNDKPAGETNNKTDAVPPGSNYWLRKRSLQRSHGFKKAELSSSGNISKQHLKKRYKDDKKCLKSLCTLIEEALNSEKLQESCETKSWENCDESWSLLANNDLSSNSTKECCTKTNENIISTNVEFPEKVFVKVDNLEDVPEMVLDVKIEPGTEVKVEVEFIKEESVNLEISNSFSGNEDLISNITEEVLKEEKLELDSEITMKPIENIDLHENKKLMEQHVVGPCDSTAKTLKIDRGLKRNWKYVDESGSGSTGGKKLKTEMDHCNREVESETEVSTEEKLAMVASKATQKLVLQSRGSRMLALVPESPKLNEFLDSPPSSKLQAMKPPNVDINSRASKMLALLPELQETGASDSEISIIETTQKVPEDDNAKKGIRGYSVGIIHHLTPIRNKSGISSESPKRSPMRQRRSIRFDDDRNETITYFTDSPPCQTIKSGMKFRGIVK